MDLWCAADLTFADGRVERFGPDERFGEDMPRSVQKDSQIPGGWAGGSLVLPRPADLVADEAKLFADARVYGPGGTSYYEGRVIGVPQVGVSEISLQFEGWVNELDDDEFYRLLVADQDLSHWSETPSPTRQAALGTNWPIRGSSFPAWSQVLSDEVLQLQLTDIANTGVVRDIALSTYRSPVPIGGAYLSVTSLDGVAGGGLAAPWKLLGAFADDDTIAAWETMGVGNMLPATTMFTTITPGTTRKAIELGMYYDGVATVLGAWAAYIRDLTVVGTHGLTRYGTGPGGYLGSDILAHVLEGTSLNFTPGDSIEPSTFPIPHYAFLEPGRRRQVVEEITGLSANVTPNDWGVYEGREFFHKAPGTYGKTWRVRKVDNAESNREGPEAKSRTSGYVISYQDGSRQTHTVGPPGSGADFETADLQDSDPDNPANRLTGKVRHEAIGITSQEGATNYGRMLLAAANAVDWRGTTTIKGDVTDDKGHTYPTAEVKAGDWVLEETDDYPKARPIIESSYTDDLAVKCEVGAPGLRPDVLLAQLVAATDLVSLA